MPDVLLIKDPSGVLRPATDEARQQLEKFKDGEMYMAKVTFKRKGKFHQKWIVLLEYAFGLFCETHPEVVINGIKIKPDFDRFRHDVTIMAGFCRGVINARGEARLIPESISFDSMTEERFDKLYSVSLDVIIEKVLHDKKMTAAQVDEAVKHILKFA